MIKSHLAIEIAGHFVQFTSSKEGKIVQQLSIQIKSFEEDLSKDELSKCFQENLFLNNDFEEVTLSFASRNSSLVPNNVFADSTPAGIYKLCFGDVRESSAVDFNRISELSIVNVYDIPDWIKHFFVLKFPRIIIQHEGTHTLRSILNSNTFHLKIDLIFHADYFCMSIVKHSNLEFYSFFDYQNFEDVIYHVLFALQQKELVNEKGSIELITGQGTLSNILEDLKKNFGKIKELSQLSIDEKKDFIAQSHQLCV